MINSKIVCTYLYSITKYGYPPKADATLKYIDEMHGLGFNTIELEGIREEHLIEVTGMKKEIKKKLVNNDLQLPYFGAVLPGLTSLISKEQELQFDLLKKACEAAKLFGSQGILDNAPLPPYEFPSDIPVTRHYDEDILGSVSLPKKYNWKYVWDHIVETYRIICDITAEYGLTYQIHPAVGLLASSADGFLNLFNSVKKDNLRFNFDTANQYVMKENINLSFIRLAEHIDYIHISDNRGTKVEHLPLGEGKINWELFFETIDSQNFDGFIGLDIGGAETEISDIDKAYKDSAEFVMKYRS
jgi:sugar phosphate isomerase/epimerase